MTHEYGEFETNELAHSARTYSAAERHVLVRLAFGPWLAVLVSSCVLGACREPHSEPARSGSADSASSTDAARPEATSEDVTSVDKRDAGGSPDVPTSFPSISTHSDVAPVDATTDDVAEDRADVRDAASPDLGEARSFFEHCRKPAISKRERKWLTSHSHCLGQGDALFEDETLASGAAHWYDFSKKVQRRDGYGRQIGGGVAMNDFNGDGDLDLYIANGGGSNTLLMNRGDGTFLDCTEYAGVGYADDWTNGVSAADYDNDGDQDLYLANAGQDRLLKNEGKGQFVDVTEKANVGRNGRSSTASWGDLDGNGTLDLAVASMGNWGYVPKGMRLEETSGIYENLRGERFERREYLFALPADATYLTPLIDADHDGDLDLLFMSEFKANQLYRNEGPVGPNFKGWLDWTNVSKESTRERRDAAVMGMDVLDVNSDGLPDLVYSNLFGVSPNGEVLLVNQGDMKFREEEERWGIRAMSRVRRAAVPRYGSWGVRALDVENDGDRDLYYVYGQILLEGDQRGAVTRTPDQPNAVVLRGEDGRFEVASGTCAEDKGIGRGVAGGDLNGDGCMDLYVVNQRGSGRLLMNRCHDAGHTGHYLTLRLVGRKSSRDPVGARVRLKAGGDWQYDQVLAGSRGVHSSSPKRLHFGLGSAETVERVEITWPSGQKQVLKDLPVDRVLRVLEPRSLDE